MSIPAKAILNADELAETERIFLQTFRICCCSRIQVQKDGKELALDIYPIQTLSQTLSS